MKASDALVTNPSSPFARNAQRYIDNGLPVIPIAPGTKRPGEYAGGKWRGMSEWQKYSTHLPTELELDFWHAWPDAGMGLLTGALAGVVAIDIDTEDKAILAKIHAILPPSPVRKMGRKGYTAFYRFRGEVNKSWRVNSQPVMDLLAEGRQTLMPGTLHPDGMTYVWLTEDTLDNFELDRLPQLPGNFIELMNRLVEPLMTTDDKKYLRNAVMPADPAGEIQTGNGFVAAFFRRINTEALNRLDEWVPRFIPGAKPNAIGYRCRAFWRNAQNMNVGIARSGIRDFGGEYGMTAIDLVMHAQNVTFAQAVEALRLALNIPTGDELTMTVNGKAMTPDPDPAPAQVVARPRADRDPLLVERERQLAKVEQQEAAVEDAKGPPDFILQPPGMLGRIVGWMAQTAPKYQPELFVAAAIAVGAAAMGRLYRSDHGNFTSLFIVMVALSGEGKEHPQQCVTRLLSAAGLDKVIAGAGYTSSSAVISALMRTPSHVAIIDEVGKLLKFSRALGQSNSEAAIDKLVEVFGKCDGVMKPQNYSMTGLTPQQAANLSDRVVHNPVVSLLGATTPATFYQALTDDLVREGFLGRVITVQSKMPRQMARMVKAAPPPEDAVVWCKSLVSDAAEHGDLVTQMNPLMPATPVTMAFTPESVALLEAFEKELTFHLKPRYESTGLDNLLVRTREKAMRLSMIVAKAMNAPKDNQIRAEAADWAIKYVRHYDLQVIESVQVERSETIIEAQIKKLVGFIGRARNLEDKESDRRVLQKGGMPRSKLMRAMKMDKRTFDNVVDTAIEQGLISKTEGIPALDYAGVVYWLRA
ncbi:DUF3987 domain-containing protein [Noviherbaspirillum cavernae]|uniref:DUF3987 domain-containing protein n=1 Tax=Noviherbaspirillum cavernae TaxID=2320862 RepID=A0A418X0H1_9BURK|nr:bifunctional DNA primase/polymerase [Noviherbaspirillum cavernae]RJG05987.1 DUF3987 domain-containing protein [Noviherbaspirillum cavernae]